MSRATSLLLAAAFVLNAAAPARAELDVSWDVPSYYVPGQPFVASVRLEAIGADEAVETWYLGAGAFEVDGEPIAVRATGGSFTLADGDVLELEIDLRDHLTATAAMWLAYAPEGQDPTEVPYLEPASVDLDFMSMPVEELGSWWVLLRTVSGPLLLETWPDVAPDHTRNFLDLAHTGFYDRTLFSRVWRGFMIQGGSPNEDGSGDGPRTLDPEFSDVRHMRGVLSMARGPELDSASYQFFIMQADTPEENSIDGQYTAFGMLRDGFDTLDAIASQSGRPISGNGDVVPFTKQWIQRAVVVRAPGE